MATLMRLARCMSVSVGTTALSAVILVGLSVGLGVHASTANAIAVVCGIPPSYLGNRRWVWRRTGRHDVRREVLPFWVLSLAGLVVSTALVGRVGDVGRAWPPAVRALMLPAAMAAVFGTLWIVQYLVLDRVIFRARARPLLVSGPTSRA
jgi:putative flippase GtrA